MNVHSTWKNEYSTAQNSDEEARNHETITKAEDVHAKPMHYAGEKDPEIFEIIKHATVLECLKVQMVITKTVVRRQASNSNERT